MVSNQLNEVKLSQRLDERLRWLWSVLPLPSSGRQLWSTLSDADRENLDNKAQALLADHPQLAKEETFVRCHAILGGTVGMWRSLHQVSNDRAMLDIAAKIGSISMLEYKELQRELPNDADVALHPSLRPTWDKTSGELRLGDHVVRRIQYRHDSRLHTLLDAFQAANWANLIQSPFEHAQWLRDSVKRLNLKGEISFHVEHDGKRVRWQLSGA